MKKFRMVMYGIIAVLAASGCHGLNRHDDRDGYHRDGSRYSRSDRNDRRWDAYYNGGYSRRDRRDWAWDRN